ncbi:MAG: helix-turn-helix domain-containing protein [Clostridia bacterium]|nr:helix-turn-helix domain-containing protein [Clostridia bacterium]
MGNITEYVNGVLKCSHNLTEFPKAKDFHMHAHDVYELYVFISGDAEYFVEGNVYKLKPGDIMIMRQGETHKLQIKSNVNYERISIHFSPMVVYEPISADVLNPFNSRPLGLMNLYRSEDFETNHYLSCVETIKKSIDENRTDAYIIAPLNSLLVEILKAYDKKEPKKQKNSSKSVATQMVDYINKNLFEELNLQKIADRFFISVSQANRVFKNSVGTSVWEYVIIKRLMAAKEMISSGESAYVVAEKCGFSDYSSFWRAYKKKFNQNPKQIKNNKFL